MIFLYICNGIFLIFLNFNHFGGQKNKESQTFLKILRFKISTVHTKILWFAKFKTEIYKVRTHRTYWSRSKVKKNWEIRFCFLICKLYCKTRKTRFIFEKNSTKTISTISMPFQAIYFIRGVHKIYKIGLCSVLTSLNNIFCSSCRFYFSFSNTRTFSKVDPNYSYFSPPDGLAICWLHFYVINGH